jgi:hypothetical protein
MQKWARWQVWAALLAGAYAALSPIWTETTNDATWTMVVLGVLTVAVSLGSLAMSETRVSEYALMLLGAAFIVSPWVIGFDDIDAMAYTAWIVGAVTAGAGVLALPQLDQRMHHGPIAH